MKTMSIEFLLSEMQPFRNVTQYYPLKSMDKFIHPIFYQFYNFHSYQYKFIETFEIAVTGRVVPWKILTPYFVRETFEKSFHGLDSSIVGGINK